MTRPLTLVHIIGSLRLAGGETIASTIVMGAHDAGHQTHMLVLGANDDGQSVLTGRLRDKGVDTLFLEKKAGVDLTLLPKLRAQLLRLQPDIIHTHGTGAFYVRATLFGRWSRCQHVHTVHCLAQHEFPPIVRPIMRSWLGRGVIHTAAISSAVGASVRQTYGVTPDRKILNGVDLHRLSASPEQVHAWRHEVGAQPEDRVLISVGRLRSEKGHQVLLHAFARVHHSVPQSRLVLVGDGPEEEALRRLAHQLGVLHRVVFLGSRDDVPVAMRAADMLVHPSFHEGLSLAVIEGMASEIPIVASRVGGLVELLGDNERGILVSPDDPAALASAISSCWENAETTRSRCESARRWALENADDQVMVSNYLDFYQHLVSSELD
jgi:glycosyltransferase involved in cell wall biosynthesis